MRYSPQEIEAFAARFYKDRTLLITPYGYTLTFTGMTAALQSTQQLAIAANADFMLLSIRHRANSAALQTIANKTAPFARMLVTDSGTNEQFTNAAVDLENYSTNGVQGQGLLPYPRMIAGRSSLSVSLTMYAPAAETAAIDIFFDGVLIRALN